MIIYWTRTLKIGGINHQHLRNNSIFPFRDQHYFREFLLATIEDCCNDYAREKLWEQLESLSWRRANLTNLPDWLELRQSWFEPGVTELTEWTLLFRRISLPGVATDQSWSASCALFHADQLRHKTIHREQLGIASVLSAMQIPRILKHEQRADVVQQTYDRWLNKDTRKEVMRFLLTPREINKGHQLLSRLQNLMEESFFNYTRRVDPGQLIKRGWDVFEQVELQSWQILYQRSRNDPWDVPYREFFSDGGLFSIALSEMRGMRNSASHRNRISRWDAMEYLKHSILLAILMDDQYQAVAIEVVGEQWLTSSSRHDVLKRLQDVFLEDTDLGTDTTAETPEGVFADEIQDSIPPDVRAEMTSAYSAAEVRKRKVNRERKRRYAVAKVIMSAELDNGRQRSRALPHRSALKSLLFNLHIPDDNEGLVDENESIVEDEAISKEAQVKADALSYIDLVGKSKAKDQAWSDQDSVTDSWGASSTNVESTTTEVDADAAGKAGADVQAETEAQEEAEIQAESLTEADAGVEVQAEAVAQVEPQAAELESGAVAEDKPKEIPSPTTVQDQPVAFDDKPLVWPPMFGRYHAVYEQMLSYSMHDIYKLTDVQLRERNWHRYSE